MTYIDLINDFWQEFEDEALRPNDALLYFYLLKVCNSKGWENPFELANKRVRLCLEITDKAIIESRDRLVERGLIEVTKGERNRVPPTYKLLRFCFPQESKKGNKRESKKVTRAEAKEPARAEAKESATDDFTFPQKAETQQNGSKNGNIIYIDKDKDYVVVDEITREEFFNDFFSENRRSTIEQLCMARAFGSIENFKRLAAAVLAEWEALPEPKHRDLKDARQHLINHCSRKLSAERQAQQSTPTQNQPPYGTRTIETAPTKRERTEAFANHIIDKLTRPDTPEFDDGFD